MSDTVSILLVDDEPRNLDALEAILGDEGYNLLRADGADRALHLLLANEVAAIVLDIKMPGVSGFELAKMIKGTRKYRQIPIVFLTAYLVDDDDVAAGYGAGAVDYLTKPIKPQILRHKIAVFAELFRKTRALAELNDTLEERVRARTAELEASEAALRAADVKKDDFLAVLAHELRNPLAPLRTGLDLLLQQPGMPEAANHTLAVMNRQLAHMVRLIDDLLDVSRISRGALDLKPEHVELGAIIRDAVETCKPFLDRREQTIHVETPTPVIAYVDAARVSQVIANILNNASKYTPMRGAVTIVLAQEGDRGMIRVTDTGVGISPDKLDRVFDMFTRIDRTIADSNRGLGIGLALARKLAEMHGGTVTAASAGEGLGTTITVSLPVANGVATATEPKVISHARAPAGVGLDILVIEDNDDNADMLVEWLQTLGHSVKIARSGPTGLALVKETRPELVLCDIGLPGMDGIEVCRSVRQLDDAPQPIMVALSGWGMAEDRRRTKEVGFDHHLVKPVAPDKLYALLESVQQGRRDN